jgi:hypothetical protein
MNIRLFLVSICSIVLTIMLTQLINMIFALDGVKFVVLSIIMGLLSTFIVCEITEKIAPTPMTLEEYKEAKKGMSK